MNYEGDGNLQEVQVQTIAQISQHTQSGTGLAGRSPQSKSLKSTALRH